MEIIYKSKTSQPVLQQVITPPHFSSYYQNESYPKEILGDNCLESPKYNLKCQSI